MLPRTALTFRLIALIGGALGVESITELAESPSIVILMRVFFLLTDPLGAAGLSLSFSPPGRYLAFIGRNAADADAKPPAPS